MRTMTAVFSIEYNHNGKRWSKEVELPDGAEIIGIDRVVAVYDDEGLGDAMQVVVETERAIERMKE